MISRVRETIALACLLLIPPLFGQSMACGMGIKDLNNPADDDLLSKCRREGRSIRADGGSKEMAWDAYDRCVTDAGFR